MLYPIATFQKAGTCLDAQQSMAKQPIKSCVSNQSRTCGKACAKHQNKFESPRRNFDVFWRTKNFILFFVSVRVSAFIGLLDSLVYATRFKYLMTLVFQRFRG